MVEAGKRVGDHENAVGNLQRIRVGLRQTLEIPSRFVSQVSDRAAAKAFGKTLGRFSGTDPDDNKSYDQQAVQVARIDPGGQAAATVRGTADDLDCWLWHRPGDAPPERSGDSEVLAAFDALLARGID